DMAFRMIATITGEAVEIDRAVVLDVIGRVALGVEIFAVRFLDGLRVSRGLRLRGGHGAQYHTKGERPGQRQFHYSFSDVSLSSVFAAARTLRLLGRCASWRG